MTRRILALLLFSTCSCRRSTPPPSPPDAQPTTATSTAAQATLTAQRRDPRPLGLSLGPMVEWSPRLPFLNLVKQARPWESRRGEGVFGEGGRLETDPDGWVTRLQTDQTARLLIAIEVDGIPERRFAVRWKGRGRLRYAGNARRVEDGPEGWTDLVTLTATAGRDFFSVELMQTDPEDPLRGLEVVAEAHLAAYAKGARFSPAWLDRLRPFRVLRFMDWMQANHTRQRGWAERPRPSAMTWRERGVPVEVMLELARAVDADPWFTLPHLADDDYVRRFGARVRADLPPGRIAYFELSNEVWNHMFGQARDFEALGRLQQRDTSRLEAMITDLQPGEDPGWLARLERAGAPYPFAALERALAEAKLQPKLHHRAEALGLSTAAALRRLATRTLAAAPEQAPAAAYGARIARICDLLKREVFAADPNRVRCVAATQTSLFGRERDILECPGTPMAPCHEHGLDTLAVAGYLGTTVAARPNHAAIRAWAGAGEAGVESLLDELVGARKLPAPVEDLGAVGAMFAHHRRVADAYGLRLVSYEGGQHLAANAEPALREDPAVTAFFTAAQRHPKMAQVYEALLDAWHEAGGELFVHYSDVGVCSKYGCWGALETVPTDSVKYRALVDWSQAHPARWPNRAR